jgi:hypothetical protein
MAGNAQVEPPPLCCMQEAFVSALQELGVHLAPADWEIFLEGFSHDVEWRYDYLDLVHRGKESLLRQPGGYDGYVSQSVGKKLVNRVAAAVRGRYGTAQDALAAAFKVSAHLQSLSL